MPAIKLSDFLYVEVDRGEGAGALNVDAVDAHEGVDHELAAVGYHGITEGVGHYIHGHSRLDADAIGILCSLGCDAE